MSVTLRVEIMGESGRANVGELTIPMQTISMISRSRKTDSRISSGSEDSEIMVGGIENLGRQPQFHVEQLHNMLFPARWFSLAVIRIV